MFQIKSIKNVNIVVNTTLPHKFLLVQPVSLTCDPRDHALFFSENSKVCGQNEREERTRDRLSVRRKIKMKQKRSVISPVTKKRNA